MMPQELVVLLHSDAEILAGRVKALSPRVRVLTRDEVEAAPDLFKEVEIIYGHPKPEDLERAVSARWLQIRGAGVNGLLGDALRSSDIQLTNVSGIHAEPIAEHVFGQILLWTRSLNLALDQQREARWESRVPAEKVRNLRGATLGVLGAGAIGAAVARVGASFLMEVIGLRRSGEDLPGYSRMYSPDSRLEFFSRCDVVVNILPLTEATRGFMGRPEFDALPPGAILCNAGRGPTIDTGALLQALGSGRLGAALLDVTDPEPLPPEHPLWRHPRALITPHYSGAHPDYAERAGRIFLENLRLFLDGKPLRNVVDKEAGY